jgi:hypothetical protein
MSFIARLQLEKEEAINVLQCGFRFRQSMDVTGRPSTLPRGGIIRLVLESDGRTGLFEWMISSIYIKNGAITFYRYDTMTRLKTLSFQGAHCVEYYETFDHEGTHPMQIQLTISAHVISLNDATFINNWPV